MKRSKQLSFFAALNRRDLGVAAAIGLLTLVPFLGVVTHDFVSLDTATYITENPWIQPGVSSDGLRQAFRFDGYAANWHPLTWMSHMLDVALYGLDWPGGHKLTSVLLHVVTTALLFGVLLGMVRLGELQDGSERNSDSVASRLVWQCAAVALLFGLHPLRVESVAWVAERKDVLSGLFFVLSLGAYAHYVARPGAIRYVAMCVLFALGLMSKPMLVTLPVVLLLLDWWPLRRFEQPAKKQKHGNAGRLIWEKIPLFCLSGLSAVVTIYVQQAGGAIKSMESVGLADRLANAIVSCATYLVQMVWPVGLTCFYPFPGTGLWQQPAFLGKTLASVLLLATISAVVYWPPRSRRYLATGWLWYLVMLLPVIGLVTVGDQAHADRYTYLPSIGILIGVVWLVGDLVANRPRAQQAAAGALMLLVAACFILTWRQVGVWRDNRALFSHAVQVAPHSAMGWSGLGLELSKAGDLEAALEACERGVQLRSDAYTRQCLAHVLDALDRDEEAAELYVSVIEVDPTSVKAHAALANVRAQQNRLDEAIEHVQRAVELAPGVIEYRLLEGQLLLQQGELEQAEQVFRAIQETWPLRAEGYFGQGLVARARGDWSAAAQQILWATELSPEQVEYRRALCEAYIAMGEGRLAVEQANWYVATKPEDPNAHLALGLSWATQGETERALAAYLEALRLEPDTHEAANNVAWILATSPDDALRDGAEAVRLAQRVCEATNNENVAALDTLAAAYAEAGQFEKASQTMERAIELAQQYGQSEAVLAEFAQRKSQFDAGQTYRDE